MILKLKKREDMIENLYIKEIRFKIKNKRYKFIKRKTQF